MPPESSDAIDFSRDAAAEHRTCTPMTADGNGRPAHDLTSGAPSRAAPGAARDTREGPKPRPRTAADEYVPFPTTASPDPIRSFVAKGAQAIGCDASYVALPLLAGLGATIGNARRIQLKRGWTEPPILWTAIVGESGTLKTPAFKLVVEPIRKRQARRFQEHRAAVEQYEKDLIQYEAEVSAWKREAGKGKGSAGDPPEKPEAPQAERYVISDTTVEALAPILLANPRGVLLARDELAGWIGSFDRYVGGRVGGGGDAAHWLSMHNGEAIVVDRKSGTSRTICVPSASVCIAGGIQPGILNRVLGCEHRESGLLARLLLAMPPRRVKRWTEATVPQDLEYQVEAVFEALYGLAPDHDDNGDPRPHVLRLNPGGKVAWVRFYNDHAKEHAELTGDLSAAWSKLEGFAARLALVVHCVRVVAGDPTVADPDEVDETSVGAGVTLSRWFGHEAERVYGVLAESEDDRDRRQLAELIQRKGGVVTTRDLMRGSRLYPAAIDAETALADLAATGWGRWEAVSVGPRGGQPSRRFVLADFPSADADSTPVPGAADTADVDNTPCHDPASRVSVNVSAVSAPNGGGSVNVSAQSAGGDGQAAHDDLGGAETGCQGDGAAGVGLADGPSVEEQVHLDEAPKCHLIPNGWSREGWVGELRRKAGCCEAEHPDRAADFQAQADALGVG